MKDTRGYKKFNKNIRVCQTSLFGSTLENEGPLGKYFDGIVKDTQNSGETWEKNESEMVKRTVSRLLEKAQLKEYNVGILLGGDLLNQCTSCAYGLEDFDIPYLGLYGACSTFAEGMLIASNLIESGLTDNAIACATSDFCTAERQFRFPLNYGSFPFGTSQHTVTGCGSAYIQEVDEYQKGVFVKSCLCGIVIDRGIKNAANMGAAMATAAADTIMRHLQITGKTLDDYDLVATGDLGEIGLKMAKEMLFEHGFHDKNDIFSDCGIMIYDLKNQDVGCGGSGCGCSAVTFCGYLFDLLKSGKIKNLLLVGTGAMMSPQALLQGESIPGVAHLVEFEGRF